MADNNVKAIVANETADADEAVKAKANEANEAEADEANEPMSG